LGPGIVVTVVPSLVCGFSGLVIMKSPEGSK